MSHCLNPYCPKPQNPDSAKFCSSCGFKLLLGDRYRAVRPIARGGFGRTFLAVDEYKPSRPPCVIKQFFPQTDRARDPVYDRELFRREAVQLEALGAHPQIPELLAHFEQAEYQYLVQEFIDGVNLLEETARTGAFNEVQIWHLLNDLLPVLTFIHDHQVIHRDLKPQNIIRRASTQQLVIVDFGAAKSMSGADQLQTGTSIGSPMFAAPEQALGKATFASDLYSLGVTCIYLLTQVRPADLFDTEEGTWLWQNHLTCPISLALGRILDKLLQGPIKWRYQSAADVLRDLNAQPVMAALGLSTDGHYSPPSALPTTHPSDAIATASPTNPSDDVRPQSIERAPQPDARSNQLTSAESLTETVAPVTQHQLSQDTAPRWVCTHTLTDHSSWVRSIVINPNGQTFASGSGDRTIKIWDLSTGTLLRTLAANSGWIRAIAVSPDGQILASCNNDRQIILWDWETGQRRQTIDGHTDWVRALCFSPDGRLLVSGSQDKSIRLWYLPDGKSVKILTGHAHWVIAVAVSPDSRMIASGGRDKTVRVWHASTGHIIHVLDGHQDAVNAIAISPDGHLLASASDDSTIRLWNLQTGNLRQVLSRHGGAVNALAISADGKTLVSGSQDTTIKLWSLETGALLQTLTGHTNWVWSVAASPEQSATTLSKQRIVSGSWDATVKIWQQI